MTPCRWCSGPHEIHDCPTVLAAFGRDPRRKNAAADPSVYRANPRKGKGNSPEALAGICARVGCGAPRWKATPYCVEHRREVVRASDAKRRAARKAS